MSYKIISVGEPRGFQNAPFDDRLYSVTVENENGTIIQTDVPVCLTKKSLKILFDTLFLKYNQNSKVCLKVGDLL